MKKQNRKSKTQRNSAMTVRDLERDQLEAVTGGATSPGNGHGGGGIGTNAEFSPV